MITKIADHNNKLYDALFDEISTALGGSPITGLEEYFGRLEAIGTYIRSHPEKSYFLRLPVDENMITIDANARTITLPENYRKNGIAVVGDTFAETLWLKVDRYYDLQDLSLTNIYIFWELPDKTKGYSTPAFKDINSEAGQLIFNWTIPDLLTAAAGNIKFYVSFQISNDAYVFNTIPQSAKINATLDAKVDSDGIQYDSVELNDILSRLHNTTNIGAIVVSRPRISSLTSSEDVVVLSATNASENIDVYAYTPDNGVVLTYTLYKNGEATNLTSSTIREQTKDTVANPHKIYYSAKTGTDILDNTTDLSEAYEEGKRFVITEKGSYQCQVIATRTIDPDGSAETNNSVTSTSAPAYTYRWVWEEPTTFVVKEGAVAFQDNKDGIITSSAENNKTINIVWPKDDKESPQQRSALYSAYITVDAVNGGTAIAATTVTSDSAVNGVSTHVIGNPFINNNNLVVGTSTVRVAFTKTLNKITIPTATGERPVLTLPIQSEAEAYPSDSIKFNGSVTGPYIQEGSGISITFTAADFNDAQTYYRTWQRLSGGKWTDIGNQIKIENTANANFEQSFSKSGTYRLKLVAKFGKSSKETVSDALVTVFNVSD